jgi:hypothetical protein
LLVLIRAFKAGFEVFYLKVAGLNNIEAVEDSLRQRTIMGGYIKSSFRYKMARLLTGVRLICVNIL